MYKKKTIIWKVTLDLIFFIDPFFKLKLMNNSLPFSTELGTLNTTSMLFLYMLCTYRCYHQWASASLQVITTQLQPTSWTNNTQVGPCNSSGEVWMLTCDLTWSRWWVHQYNCPVPRRCNTKKEIDTCVLKGGVHQFSLRVMEICLDERNSNNYWGYLLPSYDAKRARQRGLLHHDYQGRSPLSHPFIVSWQS